MVTISVCKRSPCRVEKQGGDYDTIIDIGASDGRWSRISKAIFPKALHILVEPNKYHQKGINRFVDEYPRAIHIPMVAGEKGGFVAFDGSDPFGGGVTGAKEATGLLEQTSVDEITSSIDLKTGLLKLDTHGYEVPILKGASKTLKHIDAIVIECYTRKINPESLRFWEMSKYLWELGFDCVDMIDPLFRPADGALWQMDLIFVKRNNKECILTSYA